MRKVSFKQPTTLQERRAVQFLLTLNKLGYGYTICIPSRELAKELNDKGTKISFMSVIAYWKALERMQYVTREMESRMYGVTYKIKRYPIQQLTAKAIQ